MKCKYSDFEVKSIICAPKNYEMLKAKYPKRNVIFSIYCDENAFIVMRYEGTYVVSLPDFKVYIYKYGLFKK